MSYIKSWDIVGYTYNADNYCDGECVVKAVTSGPTYDGWALAPGAQPESTEQQLDVIAAAFTIDRTDEHSFDSGDFPKVILADMVEDGERCGGCGGPLL